MCLARMGHAYFKRRVCPPLICIADLGANSNGDRPSPKTAALQGMGAFSVPYTAIYLRQHTQISVLAAPRALICNLPAVSRDPGEEQLCVQPCMCGHQSLAAEHKVGVLVPVSCCPRSLRLLKASNTPHKA